MARKADILTTNHGTIIALAPNSRRGRQWLDTHVAAAPVIYAEHSYGIDIIFGALSDHLRVQDTATGNFAAA